MIDVDTDPDEHVMAIEPAVVGKAVRYGNPENVATPFVSVILDDMVENAKPVPDTATDTEIWAWLVCATAPLLSKAVTLKLQLESPRGNTEHTDGPLMTIEEMTAAETAKEHVPTAEPTVSRTPQLVPVQADKGVAIKSMVPLLVTV